MAQNMDKSLSIVILSVHPLKQHLQISFFYFHIISSGHRNLLPGNCQFRPTHAFHMVYVDNKALVAAKKRIPAYLPFQIA